VRTPRSAGRVLALALALAAGATAAFAAAPAPEPPFHITADNMTGGRTATGDVLFLNGNLKVRRGSTVLTADNGRYERTNGLIDLTGNVRLVDSTTTVTCNHAAFSETDDRLNLDGNVVITDRDAVLQAPYGWYNRRLGSAFLGGGVLGHEKEQRLRADEAYYVRDSLLVKARGHVRGWDDSAHVELEAQRIDFDRGTRVAVATGQPVLQSRDPDSVLTTMSARLLRVNSRARTAEAVDSVLIVRDTLRVRADHAFFNDSTGYGLLVGSPRAWDNETRVTGDTLELLTHERRLQRVVVRGQAVMDYAALRETNAGETSRLTGSRIDVFVTHNRIDSLLAVGKAQNEYAAPKTTGKTQERNLANGDSILVWFKDRKVDHARVVGHAQGEYRSPVNENDTLAIANEVVRYDGRVIEFEVPQSRIVLDGSAHLTYGELELSSRRVEFDSEKQTLIARGRPVLLDKGDEVDGNLMTYDLESRTGNIYKAETKYEKGIYRGEEIHKAGENQLDVMHGSYTTCDLAHPHYHFAAREMKIYLKDKLVAKPVVFYLRNVPILALPFYVFPIKPGRHSGFLFPNFEFGFNNQNGQFLRNAGYYWALNDYMDLTLAGDYYQAEPAWAIRAEGNYKLLYAFDGNFNGRFEHNDATKQDDYVFAANHTQEITPRTRLVARGNFTSSRAYSNSALSGGTLEQRLNRFLNSSVSVTHAADWGSFAGAISRIQDLDADEAIKNPSYPVGSFASLPNLTTTTPSLSFLLPTRTIGSWGVFKGTKAETTLASTYFSLNSQFLSYGTHQGYVAGRTYGLDSLGAVDSSNVTGNIIDQRITTRRGLQSTLSLADSRRLWGWLNTSPSVSANVAVFDFDEQGHRVVPAATWSSQMGLSTTLYGTFRPPIPKVAGLRHVVTPSASVSFSPAFPSLQFRDSSGVLRNRFNSFGGIGVSGFKSAFLSFGLDQRFQLKLKDGDKITRLDNLVSWTTSGGYYLLQSQRQALGGHGFTPLTSTMLFQPPGVASGTVTGTFDVYQGRPLRNLAYNFGVNLASSGAGKQPAQLAVDQSVHRDEIEAEDFHESWRLSMAYSYSGGYAGPSWGSQKTANAVLSYQLSPNWKVDYSTALDLTRRMALSQRFSLTRVIHCWDAVFTRSFTPGGEAEYYFRLGVRDQKEIYYERGSRVQSFGGIQ